MSFVNVFKLNLLAGTLDPLVIILGAVCVAGLVLIAVKAVHVSKAAKAKKEREKAKLATAEEVEEVAKPVCEPTVDTAVETVEQPAEEVAEERVESEVVAEEVAEPIQEEVVEEVAVEEVVEEPAQAEPVAPETVAVAEEVAATEEVAPVEEKISYIKSYLAKLSLTRDTTKKGYSLIKNTLLSYAKVKSRISWKEENFRVGRTTVAKITVKGRTVIVYLALDVAKVDGKYTVMDASNQASKKAVPCMYKLSGVRRFKYACQLIAKMFDEMGIAKVKDESVDYCKHLQVTDMEQLAEIGLVKVSKSKPVNFNKFN
jgi:hypothetical protein